MGPNNYGISTEIELEESVRRTLGPNINYEQNSNWNWAVETLGQITTEFLLKGLTFLEG